MTLIQTRKVKPFPVILAGDDGYWAGLLAWFEQTLVARGKVRPDELSIFKRARTPGEVVELIKHHSPLRGEPS